jgi:hypothetical protein
LIAVAAVLAMPFAGLLVLAPAANAGGDCLDYPPGVSQKRMFTEWWWSNSGPAPLGGGIPGFVPPAPPPPDINCADPAVAAQYTLSCPTRPGFSY